MICQLQRMRLFPIHHSSIMGSSTSWTFHDILVLNPHFRMVKRLNQCTVILPVLMELNFMWKLKSIRLSDDIRCNSDLRMVFHMVKPCKSQRSIFGVKIRSPSRIDLRCEKCVGPTPCRIVPLWNRCEKVDWKPTGKDFFLWDMSGFSMGKYRLIWNINDYWDV